MPGELQTEALDVFTVTGLKPEEAAYAIAGRSRSPLTFKERSVAIIEAGNTVKALDEFSNEYGHESIRDEAFVTKAMENFSMVVQEILISLELYFPQVSSTRFQQRRFQARKVYIPPSIIGTPIENLYRAILVRCFNLFDEVFRWALREMRSEYTKPAGMDDKEYQEKTRARALDIARACLPGATLSSLGAWINSRQAQQQIRMLRSHPWEEARAVGEALLTAYTKEPPFNPRHKWIEQELQKIHALAQPYSDIAGQVAESIARLRPNILFEEPLLPTLVKHTEPTGYEEKTYTALRDKAREVLKGIPFEAAIGARLMPPHSLKMETACSLLFTVSDVSYRAILERLRYVSALELQAITDLAFLYRGKFDLPIPEVRSGYKIIVERVVPEAQNRDLRRHRNERKFYQPRHWQMPYLVPTRLTGQIRERYIAEIEAIRQMTADPLLAREDLQEYVLPMAFARRGLSKKDFWQALYVGELRTAEQGDQVYREIVYDEVEQIRTEFPSLGRHIRATDPGVMNIFKR